MITTAIAVGSDGKINLGAGPTYGILVAILVSHGFVCSAATSIIARLNLFYVFVNGSLPVCVTRVRNSNHVSVGTSIAAIIVLLVSSGSDRVSTHDAFTLFENNTGWSNGKC